MCSYRKYLKHVDSHAKTTYAGISAHFTDDRASNIAISVRDTTYLLDFIEKVYERPEDRPNVDEATEFIVSQLIMYTEKHLEKIIGLAMPRYVAKQCPKLCARLWADVDIIPLVLPESSVLDRFISHHPAPTDGWNSRTIDEQAESMGRKCVRYVDSPRK